MIVSGINAQMTVPLINFKTFINFTENQEQFQDISQDFNLSLYNEDSAFEKLHIRVRPEIVAADFPLTQASSTSSSTSRYVTAQEW
jgi:predicted sulfurtransferase